MFHLDGEKVIAFQEAKFVASGTKITATSKEDLALKLGVAQDVVTKVLRKKTSGIFQTPKGEVKIQRLKPGEKPLLPAVRVLWNDNTEKQDFFSFAAAAKELKIDPKTIPTALKAGRDSFVRKSDGEKFTIEIPDEFTPTKLKTQLSEEEKAKRAEAARRRMIAEEFRLHFSWVSTTSIEEMQEMLYRQKAAGNEERERKKHPPQEKEKSFEEKQEGKKDTVELPAKFQEKSPKSPAKPREKSPVKPREKSPELPEVSLGPLVPLESPAKSPVKLKTKQVKEEEAEEEADSNSSEEQPKEEQPKEEQPKEEEDSDSAEEFNEDDFVYLGMGLYEKKKTR